MDFDWHALAQVSGVKPDSVCHLLTLSSGIGDFFPYFNFLKVPHSTTWEEFSDSYCKVSVSLILLICSCLLPTHYYM